MSKSIEWSPRSRQDYLNLLEYLHRDWGEKVIKRFNDILQSKLKNIAERPELYPASGKTKKVRRCVINRQISLYYRIKKNKIELITLFDTRQDPEKISKYK